MPYLSLELLKAVNSSVPDLTDAQLMRLIQSCGDFQQALSALTFLFEECDYAGKYSVPHLRKFRCYESAAIIAFSRPFDSSRGRTALGLRAVGVQLSAEEKVLKSKVVELRNRVIAHSDEESMHFKISTIEPVEGSGHQLPILLFQEALRLEEKRSKRAGSIAPQVNYILG